MLGFPLPDDEHLREVRAEDEAVIVHDEHVMAALRLVVVQLLRVGLDDELPLADVIQTDLELGVLRALNLGQSVERFNEWQGFAPDAVQKQGLEGWVAHELEVLAEQEPFVGDRVL